MECSHTIEFKTCLEPNLSIKDSSIALVVTSPPYPMVPMWDVLFSQQCPGLSDALHNERFTDAHRSMHQLFTPLYTDLYRVVLSGGWVAINIGDAVRTSIKDGFSLYDNTSPIIMGMQQAGFTYMTSVIWHKPTNSPNKFMGSGMYPCGAYVTLEHERILLFRKGSKRVFKTDAERLNRRKSGYFYSERNEWFSDIWAINGCKQSIDASCRDRSGAFPFDIPYRLINMYSVIGDTIYDPFAGVGTSLLATLFSFRNFVGCELESSLKSSIYELLSVHSLPKKQNSYIRKQRLIRDSNVWESYQHMNYNHPSYNDTPVKSSQECDITLYYLVSIEDLSNSNSISFNSKYQPL